MFETLPRVAIQKFDILKFQPDFNFNVILAFFLPINKQLVPAALAITEPE